MVAGWMLYFMLVSTLLLGAGLLLEEAARRMAMPQRGIWAAVLAGSVLLPLLTRTQPQAPSSAPVGAYMVEGITGLTPAFTVAGGPSRWSSFVASLPPLDPILLGVWGGATGVLLLIASISILRLRSAMRGWTQHEEGQRRILVSESTGPAVVGVLGGSIVLPRWAMSGDPGLCRLMLSHEEEHLRARDPFLLLVASLLVVLLPWNLPLWWQLRRLRLAVEVDCDARVLRRGSDLRAYATLLMEVGRRRAGLDPALLAFAEPASFLERRIRIMTSKRGSRGWMLAALCAAVSAALIAGACGLDQPTEQVDPDPVLGGPEGPVDVYPTVEGPETPGAPVVTVEGPDASGADEEDGQADSVEGEPAFTPRAMEVAPGLAQESVGDQPAFSPRDVEPSLLNRTEFARRLEEAYPPVLRNAGIGGRVLVWVYVDESGEVGNVRVHESSGHEQIDAAALHVMRTARFSPAQLDGAPVAVWIALPVTMGPEANAAPNNRVMEIPPPPPPSNRSGDGPPQATGPISEQPVFTPREVEPALQNRTEFGRALERGYPQALKNAGIGGRVLLWVFVSEDGKVGNVRLSQSSGRTELDEAAIAAMRTAEFSPAVNRGNPVPVWVALPVTFATTTQ